MEDYRRHKVLFDAFVGLRSEIAVAKALRVKSELHAQWAREKDIKDTLAKWRTRTAVTRHFNKASVKAKRLYAFGLARLAL